MLSERTKTYMRLSLEKELYSAIFRASEKVGDEGILYFFEEAPAVLEEIIQKYGAIVSESVTKHLDYRFER